MKVVDKNFNEINSSSGIEQTINYIKESLEKMNIEKNILLNVSLNINDLYIQVIDDETYSIKLPNGSLKENKIFSSVGALKTNMEINVSDKELYIKPGIVMRENFNNHQLIHEILHGISSKQHNFFDDDQITYTKTGTKIDYYDKSLNDYYKINNLSSDGLNEGISELLTSKLTNEYTGTYAVPVVISSLFMKSNNYLLNAYFMNDTSGIEKFYKDVEEKQSIINRDDFNNLTSKSTDFELISKIINAGIEYNKSYGKEITEDEFNKMIHYLDNNVILDSGSWQDLINGYNKKKTY